MRTAMRSLAAALLLLGSAARAQEEPRMKIESPAFAQNAPIPKKHAYKPEGENVSPPLRFSGVPKNAADLVLLCHDPDAPRPYGWTHWVLYNMPPETAGLAEGSSGGFTEGATDFGGPGWGGPLPPPGHGLHRYYFWLYALDKKLDAEPGLTRAEVLERIAGRVVAQERLVGTYERK